MLVSKIIGFDEECVRCVLHPLMYSKSKHKIKRESFLPPPNSNKVSLLRLAYTEGGIEFCINHGKSISKCQCFVGLASITPEMVKECLDSILNKHSLCAEIVYAPMHQGLYIDTMMDIYTNDPNINLPMHADLTYSHVEQGEVQTELRMFANELSKKAKFIQSV